MIRLILLLTGMILFLIISLPLLLVLYLIGKKKPETRLNVSGTVIRGVMHMILFFAGTKVTVIGKERIPSDSPSLFVGNHRSFFDIPITYVNLPKGTHIVAKKELSKIPLFKNWAHGIGVLFFDRNNLKEGMKMILDGIKIMKEGHSILVFAEGTRNKAETDLPLLEFHEGTFRLASKSGSPIVPVSINNAKNVLEAHFPFVRSTHVIIEFGEPIYPNDIPADKKRAVGAYVREIVTETIKKNESLI
ncbi:MAG: lysophospholipid acyltransferase family protein [Lachnospiraceae bacterium]|nr:lysophospholipid acyltransferase family protein [Lachnospiraceae bacterium]